jgi:hypothetical protein
MAAKLREGRAELQGQWPSSLATTRLRDTSRWRACVAQSPNAPGELATAASELRWC